MLVAFPFLSRSKVSFYVFLYNFSETWNPCKSSKEAGSTMRYFQRILDVFNIFLKLWGGTGYEISKSTSVGSLWYSGSATQAVFLKRVRANRQQQKQNKTHKIDCSDLAASFSLITLGLLLKLHRTGWTDLSLDYKGITMNYKDLFFSPLCHSCYY